MRIETLYFSTPYFEEKGFFMSRRCELTGIGALSGNRVSHSNRKTKTRFLPNIQTVSLLSDALGAPVRLKVTAATLRSVEHNGGLDAFLLTHPDSQLTETAQRLKRQIKKRQAEKAA